MDEDRSIATLRSRVTELVKQESDLLEQAFALSRAGGDRRGVDALFARVQALQVQRNHLRKEIGNVLGTHRMHVASEVWRPGLYDYRPEVGADPVRIRITNGPLGLQAQLPGQRKPVDVENMEGTFDGPLAVDAGG